MKYFFTIVFLYFSPLCIAQNDCINAITVCGNTGYEGLTTSGVGNQELTGLNSCGFGETNSIWLKLSINNGGNLGFILTPESTDIEEDFDFYLFGPNPNCNSLGNTIRCSTTNPAAAGSANNLTGMIDTESDTFEGPGADGNNYVQSLVVTSGEFYYLVIDRPIGYSNFSIQWTGTATFNNPPTITITSGTSLNLKSCDNDGSFDESTPFNLSQNTPIIVNSQTNVTVTYHTSSNDAIIGLDAIPNSTNYVNVSNPQTIYARITDNASGCFETTSFLIETNQNIVLSNSEFSICDTDADGDDTNGKATFNINDLTSSFFAGQNISTFAIKYYLSQNDADNNINQITLPFSNTIPNQQSIFIKIINDENCEIIVEAYLKVKALPTSNNQTITQCSGINSNGLTTFDISEANDLFLNSNPNLSVSYFLNTAALNSNTPLNATFSNTSNPQTIIAKVVDNTTNCYRLNTLTLIVNTTPGRIITPLEECDSVSENGLVPFDLTSANLNLQLNETATFYKSESDAQLEINPITNNTNYTNETPYLSSVFVKFDNGISCQALSELILIVNKLPEIEDSYAQICNSVPIVLYVEPLYSMYEWETNPTFNFNQIQIDKAGDYKVKVTDSKGCEATKTFFITASEKATITNVQIDDLNGTNNSVLIDYTGIGDYEFSLDGFTFQDSNYFTNVPSGEYTIVVRDKNDCGRTSFETYVLAYPTFFTPNGDGFNDTWTIKNIDIYPNSKLEIFDRYGKLLKNLSANDSGWNGKLSNENLPADDYWFILTLNTKREIKGHFSLKR